MNILDATNKSVSGILKQYYKIPRFQRSYSWEKEEIELFYEDIFRDDSQYFIGHMVTYKISDDIKGVIDGQQRLTTITLILCAIRNKFIELLDNSLVNGIQKYIQVEDRNGKLKNVLISESSSPFIKQAFQDIPRDLNDILKVTPKTEEEKTLNAAFKQINEKINSDLQRYRRRDHKKIILKKLRDKLLETVLIYIELDSEDDAYTIFQTLNSTGKDLSLTDLVKSQQLKLLRSKDVTYDNYKDKWRELILALNKNDILPDTFFQHFWVSKNGLITKSKIFNKFKKTVSNKSKAHEMLINIIEDSQIYIFIENSVGSDLFKNADIKDSLEALRTFKVRLAHPFILSLLRCYKEKGVTAKNMRACLKRIERFHFIYTAITSSRASGISNKYAAYAKNLSGANSNGKKNKIVRDLNFDDKFSTPEEFNEKFDNIVFYDKDKADKKIVRYILTQIDRHLKSVDGRSIDYDTMTIEHIISQNNSKLGNHIGKIGNLILVDKKTQDKLKNKPLSNKINILHRYGFDKEKFFLSSELKGKRWIKDRTKKLSQLLYDLYTK